MLPRKAFPFRRLPNDGKNDNCFFLLIGLIIWCFCQLNRSTSQLHSDSECEGYVNTNDMNFTAKIVEWEKGIDYEENYWRNWVKDEGGAFKEDFYYRVNINETTPFQDCDRLTKMSPRDTGYIVLDVGAGPLSLLGSICERRSVEVIPCDPLASIYNRILAEFSIVPFKRTQYAMVEELDKVYGLNFFDWVHMRNALDHSADPIAGILQMLAVTKPGGIVHLSHHRNEAENEQYRGFHQWNLDCDSATGNFVIWNKQRRIDVNEELRGVASIETISKSQWIDCYLTKVT